MAGGEVDGPGFLPPQGEVAEPEARSMGVSPAHFGSVRDPLRLSISNSWSGTIGSGLVRRRLIRCRRALRGGARR